MAFEKVSNPLEKYRQNESLRLNEAKNTNLGVPKESFSLHGEDIFISK